MLIILIITNNIHKNNKNHITIEKGGGWGRGERKKVDLFIYMSIKNTNSGKLIVIFK